MEKYTLILPKDAVAILIVGENTASIRESIDSALSLYEIEFDTKINSLSKLIEPILIVVVG
jgi:type II secretory pathway component PulF